MEEVEDNMENSEQVQKLIESIIGRSMDVEIALETVEFGGPYEYMGKIYAYSDDLAEFYYDLAVQLDELKLDNDVVIALEDVYVRFNHLDGSITEEYKEQVYEEEFVEEEPQPQIQQQSETKYNRCITLTVGEPYDKGKSNVNYAFNNVPSSVWDAYDYAYLIFSNGETLLTNKNGFGYVNPQDYHFTALNIKFY